MIEHLETACVVCERGANIERYKHILFEGGTLRSFNGVVLYQAPSGLEIEEPFALSEERLAGAIRSCKGEAPPAISLTKDFLVLKQGRMTVRVRKLPVGEGLYNAPIDPPSHAAKLPPSFQAAVRKVLPFASADATRPWSVSVLIREGFAWATNNLSMARSVCGSDLDLRIPLPAATLLAEMPALDWLDLDGQAVVMGAGGAMIRFPQMSDEWPSNLSRFFEGMPKKLPALDPDLLGAAKTIEKLADRFVSLTEQAVSGKSATIESDYEIEIKKGKGIYSARLLSLLIENATHGDFSRYPDPVFLSAESLQICALGARPENVK